MTLSKSQSARKACATATRPPTVLVADDETTLRRVLGRELRKRGFVVHTVASGVEAVESYRRHAGEIDLLLLDVNMPGMSGPDALAAIRAADPDARCCFMTAAPDAATTAVLLAAGALAVFGKPFASVSELSEALGRCAAHADGAVGWSDRPCE